MVSILDGFQKRKVFSLPFKITYRTVKVILIIFENLNFSLQELLGLVQLDVRSIDLFDMPPMTEYELYMKRFGSSDTRQVCMI